MERSQRRAELVDGCLRGCGGEHRGEERTDEFLRRQIGQCESLLQALLRYVGTQRAAPTGIRRDKYQRCRDGGVTAEELDGKRPAERQSSHVRPVQAETLHESGKAVGITGHAERLWRIG